MKYIVIAIAILSIAGCSSDEKAKKEAMMEMVKNCAKPPSVELTLSQFGAEVKIHCPEIGKPLFNGGAK